MRVAINALDSQRKKMKANGEDVKDISNIITMERIIFITVSLKALVKKFLPKLSGAFSKILSTVLGLGINISTGKLGGLIFDNLWRLTSVGGIVALAADYFSDNSVDNKVTI